MSAAMSEELTRKLERRRNAHTRDVVGGARRELRKVLAGLVLHVGFAAAAFATYRTGNEVIFCSPVQPQPEGSAGNGAPEPMNVSRPMMSMAWIDDHSSLWAEPGTS